MPSFAGSPDEVIPVLKTLKSLVDQKADLDQTLKKLKQKIDTIEDEAFKRMESESIQNITVDGTMFFRKSLKKFSIKGPMKEDAHRWLKENGFEDLFQETVNASTLSSELKRAEESEEVQVPDDLFNHVLINKVGRRKA